MPLSKKTIKIIIWSVSGLAVTVGAFFGIRYLIKPKTGTTDSGGVPPTNGTGTGGTDTGGTDTGLHAKPTAPSGKGSAPPSSTETTEVTEILKRVILIGDQHLTWTTLYALATNLGISKAQVDAIVTERRAAWAEVNGTSAEYQLYYAMFKSYCNRYGIAITH